MLTRSRGIRVALGLLALSSFACAGQKATDPPPASPTGQTSAVAAPEPAAPKQPSFVVVLTDDLDKALYEQIPGLKTSMGAAGTTFDHYYVTSSLCCPSRATMLRGQYTHNTKVYGNRPPEGGFSVFNSLGEEKSTLATWLHDAGYRTGYFGKYLNGYPVPQAPTYIPPGWDVWGSPTFTEDGKKGYAGAPYTQYNYEFNDNGNVVKHGEADADYLGDVLDQKANAFLETVKDKPFLLWVSTYTPHSPYTPAPRYEKAVPDAKVPRIPSFNEPDVTDKPGWVNRKPLLDEAKLAENDVSYRKRMQGMLSVADMIDHIVASLQKAGRLDDTYVIFVSDNGYHLGEHRLKSGKQTAYEHDVVVPFAIRGPGVPAGKRVQELAVNVDLAPTIADLAGVKTPDFVDGRSLAGLIRGETPATWRRALLLDSVGSSGNDDGATGPHEHPDEPGTGPRRGGGQGPQGAGGRRPGGGGGGGGGGRKPGGAGGGGIAPPFHGLRTTQYTYVEYEAGDRELYDNTADPYQLSNLAQTADAALVQKLSTWLGTLKTCAAATCRTAEDTEPK